MSTLERAIEIAAKAHIGQIDKGGHPYILHPLRVMLKMSTEEEQIVAVLHDVMEDSEVTWIDLQTAGFSTEIIDAVVALTKKFGQTYEDYLENVKENEIARKVKIADLTDNLDMSRLRDITQKDLDRNLKYFKAMLYLQYR